MAERRRPGRRRSNGSPLQSDWRFSSHCSQFCFARAINGGQTQNADLIVGSSRLIATSAGTQVTFDVRKGGQAAAAVQIKGRLLEGGSEVQSSEVSARLRARKVARARGIDVRRGPSWTARRSACGRVSRAVATDLASATAQLHDIGGAERSPLCAFQPSSPRRSAYLPAAFAAPAPGRRHQAVPASRRRPGP